MTLSLLCVSVCVVVCEAAETPHETLEQALVREGVASLAKAAREEGDANRGAVVFYRRRSTCTQCHAAGSGTSPLGPDLAIQKKEVDLAYLIESILAPSKVVNESFRAVQVLTEEGRLHVGLVARETPDVIALRNPAKIGEVIEIKKKKIETRTASKVSLMPTGVVNQLQDRAQFLDLVRYLADIAEHGPDRARQLAPDPDQLDDLAEDSIDHAAQIRNLGSLDLGKSKQLYTQYCVNCHGKDGNKTVNPLARRFAKDPLRFGADPYAMWKTITYGNGLMFPQAALLSPGERYLVVNYIREQFVKDSNPSQYSKITDDYLAAINARAETDAEELGPAVANVALAPGMIDGKQGQQMDYGPYMCHSVVLGVSSNKNAARFPETTERSLLVKLPGNFVACYDAERLSLSAVWKGDIASTAKTHHTSYKGNSCLKPGGDVVYKNVDDRGWASDPNRVDDEEMPVTFEGHYLHGAQVLLRYKVGDRAVAELPGSLPGDSAVLSRTLRVAPGDTKLHCLAARLTDGKTKIAADNATLKGRNGLIWASLSGNSDGLEFVDDGNGGLWIQVPANANERVFTVWFGVGKKPDVPAITSSATPDLELLTVGGPRRWPKTIHTSTVLGEPTNGYAADEITIPYANPWGSWMRTTALDFFSDGRAAI
ncbi:MAG: c-type cytochrome, partial [Pirellulales bacterium]|nr:c-type cytochrome [Pirellulales bacterium]